ncbi:MAG: hypothetical protein DRN66_00190 [Candidatus Nanohalarchaeota archaeon]|nr:MAG: hypothetical protein DRN66_00190 [Candidatus Nanohaloarchaeota archaeon]
MKPIKLVLGKKANEEYQTLNKIAGEETEKGINKSVHQQLLKSINKAFDLLKQNPVAGMQMPKKNIPKTYIDGYGINNLWKFNLTSYWQVVYSLRTNEIEIIELILDIIDHKKYDKIFGYKK